MSIVSSLPMLRARWQSLAGRRLVRRSEHPKILDKVLVQEESIAEIRNPLEQQFYDSSSSMSVPQPARHMYSLRDVWIVGKQGYVYLDDNTIFSVCPSVRACRDEKLGRPVRAFSRTLREPVFHLTGRNARNRAHFLVEQLPRLVASLEALETMGDYGILLSPGASSWQMPFLTKLGIPPSRCIEGSKGTLYCKTLYYTPMLWADRSNRMSCPDHYRRIKDLVRENTPPEPRGEQNVLFISRSDASVRLLRNEDQVVGICRELFGPLETVSLTGTSLDDKMAMFSNASVIIGPHGQGFRNNLFADGCLLIQLSDGETGSVTNNWREIFSALGLLGGNRAITLYSETSPDRDGHWTFPAERLRAQLRRLQEILAERVEQDSPE